MKTFFLKIYYSFCKVESAFYHYGNTTAFSSCAMLEMMVNLELGLSLIVTTLLSFLSPLTPLLSDNIYGYFSCFIVLFSLIHFLRRKYIWKNSYAKELKNQEKTEIQQNVFLWFIVGILVFLIILVFAVFAGVLFLINSP